MADTQIWKDQYGNMIIDESNGDYFSNSIIALPNGDKTKRKSFTSWNSAKKYLNTFHPRKRLNFEEI